MLDPKQIQVKVSSQTEADEVAKWFEAQGIKRSLSQFTFSDIYNYVRLTERDISIKYNIYMVNDDFMELSFVQFKAEIGEDWRECINVSERINKNITLKRNYKIVRDSTPINVHRDDPSMVVIINNIGKEEDCYAYRFAPKTLSLMEQQQQKKIIGWKLALPLPGIPKDTEGKCVHDDVWEFKGKDKSYGYTEEYMKENPNFFIPIYEPDKPAFKEITMGNPTRKFKIWKGRMTFQDCDNNDVECNIKNIRAAREYAANLPKAWGVDMLTFAYKGMVFTAVEMSFGLAEYDKFQKD